MRTIPALSLLALLFFGTAGVGAESIERVTVSAGAMPGAGLDLSKLPTAMDVLEAADLTASGPFGLLTSLTQRGVALSLNDAQANPFQPDLVFRGFDASPLQGNAQGLAVYLDGVRFNQPFGDTVDFDLLPDMAIARLTLAGTNPVFGTNALGGALSVELTSGFLYTGLESEIAGGSFGRAEGAFQYGVSDGKTAFYAAGDILREDGWREHSPSRLARLFTDIAWRGKTGEIHLSVLSARTNLTGNGAVPVELLAVKRNAVFTWPDQTSNRYLLGWTRVTYAATTHFHLQGNLYVSRFDQTTENGDASDAEACDTPAGLLCLDDGELLTSADGAPIADFLDGGPYAQLNQTSTGTTAFGGMLQAVDTHAFFGRENQLVAGLAGDAGRTRFSAFSEIGAMTASRGFGGPGIVLALDDGSIAPVAVSAQNSTLGFYVADTLNFTQALSITVSARYNRTAISLRDRLGTALNGDHAFFRFNPGAGATYAVSRFLSLYGGYATANRAPSPAELSCADPSAPCSLTNFFVGDPPLKQVRAHTFEAGLRGATGESGATLAWRVGVYRTGTDDDIQMVASGIVGRGYFRNVGKTQRQGFDAVLDVKSGPFDAHFSYSYIDATFQTPFVLNSPENPLADANGEIAVMPGDRIPGIAPHIFKADVTWEIREGLSIGGALRVAAGQVLQGDEANLTPSTGRYAVVDARADYRLSEGLHLFAGISNLFDTRYATFGTFSPTASVPLAEAPGATLARSLSPGEPRRITGGLRFAM